MQSNESRPDLARITSGAELQRWYWQKSELVAYCRSHKLGVSGNKRELLNRMSHFIETGEILPPTRKVSQSKFDWGKATLSLSTRITDSYKNTRNVRAFMKKHASEQFAFSNEFMQWMRDNEGKTLADAVSFWLELNHKKQHAGYREKPLPQNQYNQFTRALSQSVPGISSSEIRRLWAIKRSKPGPHIYQPGDENL
ncbi:MAG: DUF6434 domain-containing protein [Cyanobacteria bacterium J06649_4]